MRYQDAAAVWLRRGDGDGDGDVAAVRAETSAVVRRPRSRRPPDTAAANQLMNNAPLGAATAGPAQGTTPLPSYGLVGRRSLPHVVADQHMRSDGQQPHVDDLNRCSHLINTLEPDSWKGFAWRRSPRPRVKPAAQRVHDESRAARWVPGPRWWAANFGPAASVGLLSVPQAWAAANQASPGAARR